MVSADDDGGLQLAGSHHFVERQSQAVTIAKSDPADARRQSLEFDFLGGHVQPAMQMGIVGDQRLHLRVGPSDIFRIA